MSEQSGFGKHADDALVAVLLGNSLDLALRVNPAGTVLDFIPSSELPASLEFSTLIGSKLDRLLPSSAAADLQQLISCALSTGRIQVTEYQLPGGHLTRYHEARIVPAKDQTATVLIRDITEHKWSDDALRISESYFRRLLEDLHVGVLIFGPNAAVRLSNHIAQSLLGLTEDELLDSVPDDLKLDIPTENGSWIQQSLGALVRQVGHGESELRNVLVGFRRDRPPGKLWLLLNARASINNDSIIQLVTLTLSDVTDLRYAEIALRESEELYQSLVEGMRDCIFQTDVAGSWTFLNPAWHRITGYPVEESIGQPSLSYVHPDDQPKFSKVFHSAVSGHKEGLRLEIRLLTHNEDTVWVEIRGQTNRLGDAGGFGVSGTLVDITDRKLNQLREAELAAQKKTVETLRELLGAFTHDVRTPLTTVKTYLYLLRRHIARTGNLPKYLDAIDLQVTNLTTAVEDMATMSRLDDEFAELRVAPVDFNSLVSAVVAPLETQALAKSQDIQLLLADKLPVVYLDSAWVELAVHNLVVNAIQHNRDATRIIVRTYRHSNEEAVVVLEVSDFGSGIDPTDLPFIFERFYRGDKSRSSGFGRTGLGLAIARKIADMHGGVLTVHSVVGKGSSFHLVLPIDSRNVEPLST